MFFDLILGWPITGASLVLSLAISKYQGSNPRVAHTIGYDRMFPKGVRAFLIEI